MYATVNSLEERQEKNEQNKVYMIIVIATVPLASLLSIDLYESKAEMANLSTPNVCGLQFLSAPVSMARATDKNCSS